ncbi:MAG: hypothetical protein ACFCUJ_00565 [Thiotrichales bacterium]
MNTNAVANRRPRALHEVVDWGRTNGERDAYLREFLDEFYIERDPVVRAGMLSTPPQLCEDAHVNAYLAAVAEHLSLRYRLDVPQWTSEKSRFLHKAHFPCGLESLKAMLIAQSPAAFRRRMIFVESDPLYRPRREAESDVG